MFLAIDFRASKESISAINAALDKDIFSYTVSSGMKVARDAVAEYVFNNDNGVKDDENFANCGAVNADDIILTTGCSTALEMCFRVLANPGENILVPRPSWNYSTWILGSGIKMKEYNLDCSKNWEIDLDHLESQIDDSTKAILINNPGMFARVY